MLPCQPTETVLEVRGKRNVRESIFVVYGRVRFENGVRMAQLYDLGIDVVRKNVGSFWIDWNNSTSSEQALDSQYHEQITMITELNWVKSGPNAPPRIGDEFRSEDYKEVVIQHEEERRTRQ